MKRRYVTMVAAVLLTPLTSSAYNISHPGADCNVSSHFDIGDFLIPVDGSYHPFESQIVSCPLNRTGADTDTISDIYMAVSDQTDDDEFTCYASSCPSTLSCDVSSAVESGDADTGTETLEMGSLEGFSGGYAHIHCVVPAPAGPGVGISAIFSYGAQEN